MSVNNSINDATITSEELHRESERVFADTNENHTTTTQYRTTTKHTTDNMRDYTGEEYFSHYIDHEEEPEITTTTREVTVPQKRTVQREITVPMKKMIQKEIIVPRETTVMREITVPVTVYKKKMVADKKIINEKKIIDEEITVPTKKLITEEISVPVTKLITEKTITPRMRREKFYKKPVERVETRHVVRENVCGVGRELPRRTCRVVEHRCEGRGNQPRTTTYITRTTSHENTHKNCDVPGENVTTYTTHGCEGYGNNSTNCCSGCEDGVDYNTQYYTTTSKCGGSNGVEVSGFDDEFGYWNGSSSSVCPMCNGTGHINGSKKNKSYGQQWVKSKTYNSGYPSHPSARYWATADTHSADKDWNGSNTAYAGPNNPFKRVIGQLQAHQLKNTQPVEYYGW